MGNKPSAASVVSLMRQTTTTAAIEVPRWRRWAAAGVLATIPAWLIATAPGIGWDFGLLTVATGLAATGLGLSRRSVLVQVFARGVSWLLFLTTALGTAAILLSSHRLEGRILALAMASGGALALAGSALSTRKARADFAPVAYRRWFLASCMMSVGAASVCGLALLDSLEWGSHDATIPLAALALALAGSAFGVVRMRAWGVVLGGVTALAALGAAFFARSGDAFPVALAAVPGMMMTLPVILSRFAPSERPAPMVSLPIRVAETRVRVATLEEEEEKEEKEVEESVREPSRSPRLRADPAPSLPPSA
jgi:hypothetical protein